MSRHPERHRRPAPCPVSWLERAERRHNRDMIKVFDLGIEIGRAEESRLREQVRRAAEMAEDALERADMEKAFGEIVKDFDDDEPRGWIP